MKVDLLRLVVDLWAGRVDSAATMRGRVSIHSIRRVGVIVPVLLLMASFSVVHAQGQRKKITAKARFVYLVKLKTTPDELYVSTKDGPKKTMISTRSPGQYFKLPTTGVVAVGTLGEGKKGPEVVPLAKAKVPAGVKRLTVFLIPTNQGEDSYRLLLLDESKFRAGSIFFINSTEKAVGVEMDGKKLILLRKKTRLYRPRVGEKSRNVFYSFFSLEKMADGQTRSSLITESMWNISPHRGEVCFFYPHGGGRTTRFKVFSCFFGGNNTTDEG